MSLNSWVHSANRPDCDFPLENLPLGVFSKDGSEPHIGIAIGDSVLDLAACLAHGALADLPPHVREACAQPRLNELMSLGSGASRALRKEVTHLLEESSPARLELLVPMAAACMQLPAAIGDYTDFYASIHHATNVGRMFRPDNPLLPNYKYVPIGYHGRASSIIPDGAPVVRPNGQWRSDPNVPPQFAPSRLLDYELELGFFIGRGNTTADRIPIGEAGEHLFGACLVNDWSARDIQSWEYQPLGPFLSKSFATSISPWVITMEALEPFRVPASARPHGDPSPLPHLWSEADQREGGIDVTLEVWLSTSEMRARGLPAARLSRSRFADLYWTPAQLVAHHSSNGCKLRPGDLVASGTVSGPEDDALGCLLELTSRGTRPIALPGGDTRRFLEDGDEVILRGWCAREGVRRIGFGSCAGRVMPAR